MKGGPHWRLTVNLSDMEKKEAEQIQKTVEQVLRVTGVDPIETDLQELHVA